MPYTIDDFEQEYLEEHLEVLPPAKRVKGLTPKDAIKLWSPKELLRAMPKEQIKQFIDELKSKKPAKRRKGKQGH